MRLFQTYTIVDSVPGMALGKNVGRIMKARSLSYGDVARGIGITDTQPIWALVKRDSKKSEFAGRLADYFKVPLARLVAEDFDVNESSSASGRQFSLLVQFEEGEAIARLRKAHPDWRRYVLGLAMIDSQATQELLLRTMRQAVPDSRVEQHVSIAPHAAARTQVKK